MSIYKLKLDDSFSGTASGYIERGILRAATAVGLVDEGSVKKTTDTFQLFANVILVLGIIFSLAIAGCLAKGVYDLATNTAPFNPIAYGVTLGIVAYIAYDMMAFALRKGAIYNEEANWTKLTPDNMDRVNKKAAAYSPFMTSILLCADLC